MVARIAILVALVVVVVVPFAIQPDREAAADDGDAPKLVVVTPHVEQIRIEFERAFRDWHERTYGQPVRIDWRTPGGTSEIVKLLQGEFTARIRQGRITPEGEAPPGTIGYDLMFGGGSFDHGRLATGVTAGPEGGEPFTVPISIPAGFPQARLDEWYGENRVGSERLYHPEQYWLGTALSSFGIVYNRDVLADRGVPEPDSFLDLCDPRLAGWIALADPRQSGSITTTFDSILGNYGWDEGWRILRAMTANARYFTNSSTRPPIDVSQGEAAAGLAIDFYGRGQAQVIARPGQSPEEVRVGYADPQGAVYVDADPVSIIRGGPNPELARRFVEFTLSEEAQALWQFPALETAEGADNPTGPSGQPMGPRRNELRRMPVRRVMYERYLPYFVDQANPFDLASDTRNPGWRTGVQVMMGAFAIDIHRDQRAAWSAMQSAIANGAPPEAVAEMDALFYGFPDTEGVGRLWDELFGGDGIDLPPDALLPFTEEHYGAVRNTWREPAVARRLEIIYSKLFKDQYARVVAIAENYR